MQSSKSSIDSMYQKQQQHQGLHAAKMIFRQRDAQIMSRSASVPEKIICCVSDAIVIFVVLLAVWLAYGKRGIVEGREQATREFY